MDVQVTAGFGREHAGGKAQKRCIHTAEVVDLAVYDQATGAA
jgi:hypothetical protein